MLPRTPTIITLVSIVPFVLLSILLSFDYDVDRSKILNLLITYSTIILSFLAGTRWGMAIDHQDVHSQLADKLYMMSTFTVLLAWSVLILDDVLIQLLALALLYTFAWGVDSFLYTNKIIPLWFFTLRGIVTPIVIVSIYVSYFSIL